MIDSDALIEEKLKAYAETSPEPEPESEELSDEEAEFFEGVEALVRDEEPEESPEDIVEEARLQANEIIEKAQSEASNIIDTARAEAVDIRDEAHKEGFNHGLAEASEEAKAREEEFNNQIQARENELKIKEAGMERDLVDKILSIVDNIFHTQLTDKKNIILALVSDAMMGVEGAKHFTIKVSPDNLAFMESVTDSLAKRIGGGIVVEALSDASLDESQCVLETETGVFDCSPFRELDNLLADIRLLSMQ